ncbi:unannotated protein [freshwater metagenome]|uniref:Unannotated protein n=1 Tax=freshwater metagenome TaxID=449393 RepID=A0A6J7RY24_9ZZZZ
MEDEIFVRIKLDESIPCVVVVMGDGERSKTVPSSLISFPATYLPERFKVVIIIPLTSQ